MTSGTIMAAVEDNALHFEEILGNAEQALVDAQEFQVLLEQDIIAGLRCTPSARLKDDPAPEFEVRQALRERQMEHARLRLQQKQAQQDVVQSLHALRSLHKQREVLEQKVRVELSNAPESISLSQQLQLATQARQSVAAHYGAILEECTTKLPVFDSSPIYSFLRKRQFGTSQYHSFPVLCALDGWLAKKVGYLQNRGNEQILLAMRAHIDTEQAERNGLIASLEQQILEQSRVAQRQSGLEALHVKRSLLAKQVVMAKERVLEIDCLLDEFSEFKDSRALDIYKWLTYQLHYRDLEAVLEQVGKFSPSDYHWTSRQRQALRDHSLHLRSLEVDRQQARQTHHLAAQLEHTLRASLLAEQSCEQQCDCHYQQADCHCNASCSDACSCRCHNFCACTYNYDLNAICIDTQDYPQMLASYMKGNLALDDLMKLFARPHARATRPASHRNKRDRSTPVNDQWRAPPEEEWLAPPEELDEWGLPRRIRR
ncbi:hypothetical protein [Pseudomonas vranovensis]|uniref:Uncharacterized protein n=1 Tax=Pseudomonas vranovensis TaxID=321661 RepID=A0A423DS64_9PSED|nr:hypothetical protein [Pseudomonas vranovensis]ROL74545.1 hypothetical protein BHU25_10035 [Pseudomonas vranovensis]